MRAKGVDVLEKIDVSGMEKKDGRERRRRGEDRQCRCQEWICTLRRWIKGVCGEHEKKEGWWRSAVSE